jgi:hypothetical protein
MDQGLPDLGHNLLFEITIFENWIAEKDDAIGKLKGPGKTFFRSGHPLI